MPTTRSEKCPEADLKARVAAWLCCHPLSPDELDCATAVMLKILDGKCRMPEAEKRIMRLLYAETCTLSGARLDPALHQVIEQAQDAADDALQEEIYALRVLAETTLSRPVMKAFKARLRQTGLLDS